MTDVIPKENTSIQAYKEVSHRIFGAIPLMYSFGDAHQLPPVDMKDMHDKTVPTSSTSACAAGNIALQEFLHLQDHRETNSLIITMDKVIHQHDPLFLQLLRNMSECTINIDNINIILSRQLVNLHIEEQL